MSENPADMFRAIAVQVQDLHTALVQMKARRLTPANAAVLMLQYHLDEARKQAHLAAAAAIRQDGERPP